MHRPDINISILSSVPHFALQTLPSNVQILMADICSTKTARVESPRNTGDATSCFPVDQIVDQSEKVRKCERNTEWRERSVSECEFRRMSTKLGAAYDQTRESSKEKSRTVPFSFEKRVARKKGRQETIGNVVYNFEIRKLKFASFATLMRQRLATINSPWWKYICNSLRLYSREHRRIIKSRGP